MLSDEVKKSIEESVLCWLATVSKEGVTSVSPKEIFIAHGNEELLIANIASPNSVNNILDNPNVCVSLVHIFKQKGFKIYGSAVYLGQADEGYEERFNLLQKIAGNKFPVQGVIKISVSSIKQILAPSYILFPDVTEEQQVESAKKTYGV